MTDYLIGSNCNGFILKRSETIEEIDSTVMLFTHEKLGTPALAIKNNDPNKTFCFAFNTIPEDSTGVAHILEHSVLMGSRKYPVHDVFGEIHKGGLMTFLNAMTGSDTTYYPFATLNTKEYFNIMDVYCDVTLNPLLHKTTFEQEGWHYHKESTDTPLEFQGVVFNEMKGAFSDPIRSIFHHAFSSLFPGSTYSHESGGDPVNIPDLTYDQFVSFHRRYYHPSNGILFFYGNANLDDELGFVQDNFFSKFDSPGSVGQIKQGRVITHPCLVEDVYSIQPEGELSSKTYLAVASAVGTVLDLEQNTAFQVIAQILFNSDASPLKKAIVDAGLCKDFGGLFLAGSSFNSVLMTYLIGSEAGNREIFTSIYDSTLRTIVTTGLDHDLILSELNKFEFSLRESLTKSQRGLDLISKALLALKHGADPFTFLRIENVLLTIRAKALEQGFFEHLIKTYLLDNPATVEIILQPDPTKSSQILLDETTRLNTFESKLDDSGRQNIINRTSELIELQNTPNSEESLHLLPKLSLNDLNPSPDFHEISAATLAGRPFLYNDLPTNSICYIDFGFDSSMVPADLLPMLSLFGTIVTEIGTDTMDFMQVARKLGTYTGGFDTTFSTYTRLGQSNRTCTPFLWFHLKVLDSFLEPALSLVQDIFLNVSFEDRQRIKEIVLREFAWLDHSTQSEGYSLASSRVFSHLSLAGQYNEHVNGITAYQYLKYLATNYELAEDAFLTSLDKLKELLLRRSGLTISITANTDGIHAFQDLATPLVSQLKNTEEISIKPHFDPFEHNQAFCTSSEVTYNVQGLPLFPDVSAYNGHFEVLKTWISRDYLWNTVRQMGGAYGCFVQFNHVTGNIGFVSFRDPHVAKTYAAYDELSTHLAELNISQQVLEQIIVGTYGGLVPHQSPAHKGAVARNDYLAGVSREFKLQRIDNVLSTTVDSLKSFAHLFQDQKGKSFRASIGNREKIHSSAGIFDQIVDL